MSDNTTVRILIVDNDPRRAANLEALAGILGASTAVARDLTSAAWLWKAADVVIIDDDAFGDAGITLAWRQKKTNPAAYLCVAADWSRFADVRGVASHLCVKPFGAVTLMDALAAAQSARLRSKLAAEVAAAPASR